MALEVHKAKYKSKYGHVGNYNVHKCWLNSISPLSKIRQVEFFFAPWTIQTATSLKRILKNIDKRLPNSQSNGTCIASKVSISLFPYFPCQHVNDSNPAQDCKRHPWGPVYSRCLRSRRPCGRTTLCSTTVKHL